MKNHTFKNFLKQVELNCLAMSNLSCSIYNNAKSSAKFYKEKIQIIVEYDKIIIIIKLGNYKNILSK